MNSGETKRRAVGFFFLICFFRTMLLDDYYLLLMTFRKELQLRIGLVHILKKWKHEKSSEVRRR